MKRITEKLKRIMKYCRVRYKQSDKQHRLLMGMFALVILVYAWWVIVVF
jgi:hypothetical protein